MYFDTKERTEKKMGLLFSTWKCGYLMQDVQDRTQNLKYSWLVVNLNRKMVSAKNCAVELMSCISIKILFSFWTVNNFLSYSDNLLQVMVNDRITPHCFPVSPIFFKVILSEKCIFLDVCVDSHSFHSGYSYPKLDLELV